MTPAPSLPPNASEDRAPLMIGIIVMCLIISTTAVTARIWTRKFILDQMGWDDYLTIFTLVCPTMSLFMYAYVTMLTSTFS